VREAGRWIGLGAGSRFGNAPSVRILPNTHTSTVTVAKCKRQGNRFFGSESGYGVDRALGNGRVEKGAFNLQK